MSTKFIYTDAIKDVIGNYRIVDQFDIDYIATFAGGMEDDYVTGSMLSLSGQHIFLSGTRGRAFSKYSASSQPLMPTGSTSAEANLFPRLSDHVQPWSQKVGNAYRIVQFFDDKERYYDSCLPNLKNALLVDGARVRSKLGGITSSYSLSPDGNVDIGFDNSRVTIPQGSDASVVGFILFNCPTSGNPLVDDPSTDNIWTWSYPYENKYSPTIRSLKTDSVLGLSDVSWGMSTAETGSFPTIDYNPTALSASRRTKGIMPILPGHLPTFLFMTGARNGMRLRPNDALRSTALISQSERYDDSAGFSFTIPGDVNLSATAHHVTQSVQRDDLIKFFFGFGDLNNMAYYTASSGPTMGANNYPYYQTMRVFSPNALTASTPAQQSILFGVSPIIRGWKYGIQSGLPMHSQVIFRRSHFGHPRDMLEQRLFTKYIAESNSPLAELATPATSPSSDGSNPVPTQGQLGPSAVEVKFVRQSYAKDDRGIGRIFVVKVDPTATTSHNFSTEVTSSLPYFDGVARERTEDSYKLFSA